jgi:hypothetical protein
MFDTDVAEQLSVNAAIIFQHIAFWCIHSEANGTNYHDGEYWTYSSVKAFKRVFPYLSASQIDTALKKLLEAGYIIKGNYNKSAYDRTIWYAVTKNGKSIYKKSKMENQKTANGLPENREPIPDIVPNNVTDNSNNTLSAAADERDLFDDFWKLYPRKVSKPSARTAWKGGKCDKVFDAIMADVQRRIDTEWKGQDIHYIPHPTTYIHQRRWEDETQPTERKEHGKEWHNPALDYAQRDYKAEAKDKSGKTLNLETGEWE